MRCHVIIRVLDTTGTTYTFYEIEKRKETKKKQNNVGKSKEKKSTRYLVRKKERFNNVKNIAHTWYAGTYLA